MKKCYHITSLELTQILKSYFEAKGESVSSVEYRTGMTNPSWGGAEPYFREVIVVVAEEKEIDGQ